MSRTILFWVSGIRKMETEIRCVILVVFKVFLPVKKKKKDKTIHTHTRQMTKHCTKNEWSDMFSGTDTLLFLYLYKLYFIGGMLGSCKHALPCRGKQVSHTDICGWDQHNQLVLGTENLLKCFNNQYTIHYCITDRTLRELSSLFYSYPDTIYFTSLILNIKISCSLHSCWSNTISNQKIHDSWEFQFSQMNSKVYTEE